MGSGFVLLETRQQYVAKICNANQKANTHTLQKGISDITQRFVDCISDTFP